MASYGNTVKECRNGMYDLFAITSKIKWSNANMPQLIHGKTDNVFPLYVSEKTGDTLIQKFTDYDTDKDLCYNIIYFANEGSYLTVSYNTNPGGFKLTKQYKNNDVSVQRLCVSHLTPKPDNKFNILFKTSLKTPDQRLGVNVPANPPASTDKIDTAYQSFIPSVFWKSVVLRRRGFTPRRKVLLWTM